MGCLGNSKTEDQRNEEKAQREANKKIEKQLQKDKQIYRATHRLLLLGRWHVRTPELLFNSPHVGLQGVYRGLVKAGVCVCVCLLGAITAVCVCEGEGYLCLCV